MKTLQEYNNKNTVKVIKQAANPITKHWNREEAIYNIVINNRTYHTYLELIRRFQETDWKEITIHMKHNHDNITIQPTSYKDIKTLSDVEWFLVYGSPLTLDSDSLVELAGNLCNYPYLLSAYQDEEKRLANYFNRYLKDLTHHTLRKANELSQLAYDNYKTSKSTLNFNAYVDTVFIKTLNVNKEEALRIKSLLDYSNHWSVYSDWYKEMYHRRPRLLA